MTAAAAALIATSNIFRGHNAVLWPDSKLPVLPSINSHNDTDPRHRTHSHDDHPYPRAADISPSAPVSNLTYDPTHLFPRALPANPKLASSNFASKTDPNIGPAGNDVVKCKAQGSWTDRFEIVMAVEQFCGRYDRQLFGPAPRPYHKCDCPWELLDGRDETGMRWHYVTCDGITTIYILFEVKEGYWYEMDFWTCRNSLLAPIDRCNTKSTGHKQGGITQNNSLFWRIELSGHKNINYPHHGCGANGEPSEITCGWVPVDPNNVPFRPPQL
ncbi:hypothetical protein K490DRAFT_65350 [Saccharata proteae CBS 121410]|uniref:Uncharacterized protein n=1 Tax=Saccharata proteae CBS 121410 TaxID=1314787 RepID=A0A9P4HW32_9PEZI|nr:hypothetical protein K490DRAFT_65350 [Saccharata proteae CBS 121410]